MALKRPFPFRSTGWRSVARGTSGVAEDLALHADKTPLVAFRAERELQHAVALVIVDLVGKGIEDGVVALTSPAAHHELPDAPLGVCPPLGVLRREALVVVLVAGEDH